MMIPIRLFRQKLTRISTLGCILLWAAAELFPVWASEPVDRPLKAIPDVLVYADADLGHWGGTPYAVIVDKARQQVRLYRYLGHWQSIAKWPCSTGKLGGPKEREGDQKTPVGVYFALRDVGGQYLTDTYGTRALPLDYPNLWDRRSARTGSAIWLHGTNKPLQSRDSNGCVVIENHAINQLSRYIRLNRTPVIIVERARLWSEKTAARLADQILSTADQWHQAMIYGSYQQFCRPYADGAKPSMKWWQRWCRHRRKQDAGAEIVSLMRRRAIYRYDRHFVLLFDHHLKSGLQEVWAGRRKLYLRVEEDRVAIIDEAFQSAPQTAEDPLFYAWQKIWQKSEQRSKIAVTRNGDKNT